MSNIDPHWWREEYGFFGHFYMNGDDSVEGYLQEKKQSLLERTATEASGIMRLLRLSPGERLLDIPCGYGRHSIALAQKGISVVGCDINKAHLHQARENAQNKGVFVDFQVGNMLDISFHEQFDALINIFYSFGFFESDQENERVLKNFFNALKPSGKFLMHTDVNVPRIVSGQYPADETRNLVDGRKLRIIDVYNDATKRIDGSWNIIEKDGGQTKKDYSVRVYTKDEFVNLCIATGFSSVEVFGDWDGVPYSEKSEDMIVVATK